MKDITAGHPKKITTPSAVLTDGERLFCLRRVNRLSQSDIAQAAGVSQIMISLMENDARPVSQDVLRTMGEEWFDPLPAWCRYPVLRRRLGIQLRDAARALKKSPVIITLIEHGDDYDNFGYWEWLVEQKENQLRQGLQT